jgi:hypothetical protein
MSVSSRAELGILADRGVPPSPLPSESLDWRGVCKNGLQNLEGVGVRGQNLDPKGLTAYLDHCPHTAFALAIICSFHSRGKVGCHTAAVDIYLFDPGHPAGLLTYLR